MPKIIISIICLGLSLILGVFLVWPKYTELYSLQSQIKQEETNLQSKESYLQKLQKTLPEIKKYETVLTKIDSALPSFVSWASIFDFMQKISAPNGLLLKKIAMTPAQGFLTVKPVKEGAISALPTEEVSPEAVSESQTDIRKNSLNISLSGSYSGLKNFLNDLEKSARLFKVKLIEVSAPEKEDYFNFDLGIEIYSY